MFHVYAVYKIIYIDFTFTFTKISDLNDLERRNGHYFALFYRI